MKIVVISDTHGELEKIKLIRLRHPSMNAYIHCGDSELPPQLLDGFISVKGNCDFFDYPISRTIKTPYGDIYVEHGHLHDTKRDSYVLSKNCIVFLSGHTHIKDARMASSCYVFNPGSLTRPRDGSLGSYLIINIDKAGVSYEFKEL